MDIYTIPINLETRYDECPKGGTFDAAKTNSAFERLPLCSGRFIVSVDSGMTWIEKYISAGLLSMV